MESALLTNQSRFGMAGVGTGGAATLRVGGKTKRVGGRKAESKTHPSIQKAMLVQTSQGRLLQRMALAIANTPFDMPINYAKSGRAIYTWEVMQAYLP